MAVRPNDAGGSRRARRPQRRSRPIASHSPRDFGLDRGAGNGGDGGGGGSGNARHFACDSPSMAPALWGSDSHFSLPPSPPLKRLFQDSFQSDSYQIIISF